MAQKFPDKLPPKGKGRVDNTHQIALLTDFEVQALNHLKNKDKERGFPSGSGPEIRALAAKNSRPFEFVNYRGEQIPSLNDFSEGGYGGGGDSGSSAGEQEARDQTSSGGDYGGSNDWAAREKSRKDKAAAKAAAEKAAAEKLYKEKQAKEKKKAKDIKRIHSYLADLKIRQQSTYKGQDSETLDELAQEDNSTPYDAGEFVTDTPMDAGEFADTTPPPGEPPPPPPDPEPGDGGMTQAEFIALTEEHDIETFLDSEGGIHLSQDEADTANVGFGRTGKIGEAEGFRYGTEVAGGEDEDGNAITTDESLTGGYSGAYEQMLSDAYDASKTGVGYGILGSGGASEIDPATGEPIDPYAALEGAVEGQNTYLSGLADAYQANAQSNYDDWLATNTAAINELDSLEDIEGYTWTDMPEFDTDFSGGIDPDTGEWDSDWMPDFYSGFNQEYGSDYIGDDSWQYDADGNPIAGTYATGTTGTTDTTETTDDGDGEAVTAAPGTAAPGLKQVKTAPGVAQFGSNRSAARYI
jgi:hypothetical protein